MTLLGRRAGVGACRPPRQGGRIGKTNMTGTGTQFSVTAAQARIDALPMESADALEDAAFADRRAAFYAARREYYLVVAQFVRRSGASDTALALRTIQECRPGMTALCDETLDMVYAIIAGMTLHQYLDSDSAASWLRRFGPQRKSYSEGGET
jgi:hypothetical protein